MSSPPVIRDVRQWILEQKDVGHPPEALLKAMLAHGWREDLAADALKLALRDHLDQGVSAGLPSPSVVPEPLVGEVCTTLWAHDRSVHVLAAMRTPRLVLFGGLLADTECDALIDLALARLARSETLLMATGGNEVNQARTSDGMFFTRGENPLVARIEQRMASLLGWPIENGEGLQVLRYRPGAEYKPHHDYFDPSQSGTPGILKRGGQRVGSLVCYLKAPARGGATVFPDVQFDVAPVKGNAVFFSYDRPHPMTRSLHGGAPVIEGEKWVATKWLRERRFD